MLPSLQELPSLPVLQPSWPERLSLRELSWPEPSLQLPWLISFFGWTLSPMKSSVSIGIADAKGEETRFQGKKRFFHWELLFFQRGEEARFP
ncbi:hypothetical protein QTH97_12825 [Variovorax sp. J22R24]|uniref:hypothetical protein n=1 Tax=Variovorax gracilis TaxID=3053502 RepID=UPI0025779CF0|nr:hypothetical protein [Variovorax sp. J22R24]MDM0105822.1 hypothetical protein [Variovorax sp. J22R24]